MDCKKRITLYTDGACSGNPGPGGWGVVLMYGEHIKELSGFEAETTNNRMEITAVISGLEALNQQCIVDVFTDSAYVCNTFMQGWIYNWLKNGWMTKQKKSVENRDLWERLLKLTNYHEVTFHKVKGHADNVNNNRCDQLATGEIKKRQK